MVGNGMAPGDSGQERMTADTQFVNGFYEHEFFIGGMGVMAGNATLSRDNAVNKCQPILLAQQIFLVRMTGYAERQRPFGPGIVTVFRTMRVMTDRTSSHYYGAMDDPPRETSFHPGVTTKADILNFCHRKTNSPGLD